jgi:hypothetical protein
MSVLNLILLGAGCSDSHISKMPAADTAEPTEQPAPGDTAAADTAAPQDTTPEANTSPSCDVLTPGEGELFAAGAEILLTGSVWDVESDPLELTAWWSSDLDGALGSSTADSQGRVALATDALRPGSHVIALEAADPAGGRCKQIVNVSVNEPPSVTRLTPGDGEVFNEREAVVFTAEVSDAEDPPDALTVRWESSLDGLLWEDLAESSGLSDLTLGIAGATALSPGGHEITLTVTDTTGLSATERFPLVINDLPEAPEISLSWGRASERPVAGEALVVHVDAQEPDLEADPITYRYAWSSLSGRGDEGAATLGLDIAAGEQWQVTVTPGDPYGEGASATAQVTVNTPPEAPTVQVTPAAPLEGTEAVTCTYASAADADGDSLSHQLTWWADGDLAPDYDGLEVLPAEATIEVGEWRCEVTPSDGLEDGPSASATASVDPDPEPTLVFTWPEEGSWFFSGVPVLLEVTAGDDRDAATALAVTFESDLDGALGEATPDEAGLASLLTAESSEHDGWLSAGEHLITATVVDPLGHTAAASLSLVVVDCDESADYDGDGYSPAMGDCDDTDPSIYPDPASTLGDPSAGCMGGQVVTVEGERDDDWFGYALGEPGDINGDGFPDLVVGARGVSESAEDAGAVYLFFGGSSGWSTSMSASELVAIRGDVAEEDLGSDVTALPDVDGDGLDEVVISGNATDDHGGLIYVFSGRTDWTDLTLADADLVISPETDGANVGEDLAVGDFDGDGLGDLAFVDNKFSGEADYAGAVYLIWGSSMAALVGGDAITADAADVTWYGEGEDDTLGDALGAGDVDGDGYDDLWMSASGADDGGSNAGAVYLFTGLRTMAGDYSPAEADMTWYGETSGDKLGDLDLVTSPGDVDGDGLDELMFAAVGFDAGSISDAGKVYLIYGDEGGDWEAELSSVTSWIGAEDGDLDGGSGEGLAPLGDLDGDGLADLAICADDQDTDVGEDAGRCYLFYGSNRSSRGVEDPLTEADRILDGEAAQDHAGRTVYAAGDLNGDGLDDFAVGAYGRDEGRIYIYLSAPTCP